MNLSVSDHHRKSGTTGQPLHPSMRLSRSTHSQSFTRNSKSRSFGLARARLTSRPLSRQNGIFDTLPFLLPLILLLPLPFTDLACQFHLFVLMVYGILSWRTYVLGSTLWLAAAYINKRFELKSHRKDIFFSL